MYRLGLPIPQFNESDAVLNADRGEDYDRACIRWDRKMSPDVYQNEFGQMVLAR